MWPNLICLAISAHPKPMIAIAGAVGILQRPESYSCPLCRQDHARLLPV